MKKQNLVIIALGAAAIYYFLMRKKTTSKNDVTVTDAQRITDSQYQRLLTQERFGQLTDAAKKTLDVIKNIRAKKQADKRETEQPWYGQTSKKDKTIKRSKKGKVSGLQILY